MEIHNNCHFLFEDSMLDENGKNNSGDKSWWQPGLVLFSRLAGWITGPIIIGVFLGKWLDARYHTKPWLSLLCVGIAFIISSVGIVKEANQAMKKIVQETKYKNKKHSGNSSEDLRHSNRP